MEDGAAEGRRPDSHLPAPHWLCCLGGAGSIAEPLWASVSPSVKWGQDRWPRAWHTVSTHVGRGCDCCVVLPAITAGLSWEPRQVDLGAGGITVAPHSPLTVWMDLGLPGVGPCPSWLDELCPLWVGPYAPPLLERSPSSHFCPTPGPVHSLTSLPACGCEVAAPPSSSRWLLQSVWWESETWVNSR